MTGDEDDDGKQPVIQLDYYGVRLKARPTPDRLPDPETWQDVARRVNHELMSFVAGVFRFLSQTVKAATSVVTGLGDLPRAVSYRISEAHTSADALENERANTPNEVGLAQGETIRRLINHKLAEGFTVRAIADGDHLVLAFLRPTDDDDVAGIAAAAIEKARMIAGELPDQGRSENPTHRR